MFLRDTSDILNQTAIEDAFGKYLTYGELETLGAEYLQMIPMRSLVMILCDYSIETVAFYYCQMINHVVPILVDKRLKEDLLLKIIKAYRPQFIWCPNQAADLLEKGVGQVISRQGKYLLIQTRFGLCEMNPDLALLLTTSGSTGSIKLVRLSYENLRCNISAFAHAVGAKGDDRAITTLPMYYCYGLSVLHVQWMMGACVYITEYSVMDIRFWDFFQKSHITHFAGVPYTYDMLGQIGFLEKKYDSLRFMTQGGGKLSESQQAVFAAELQKKGIRLYICYGQTEATTYISVLSYERASKKLGSVGAPISGIITSCTDTNATGEGELVCRGKSISLGYAGERSELARGDDNMGCLYTGDLVFLDEDGDIFIKGRKARFVKILGARVSLDELETALTEHFADAKFVCVGTDNKIDICCLTEGLEKEVLEFCRREMAIPGKMTEYHYMTEFPYTGSGKLEYCKLQEQFSKSR